MMPGFLNNQGHLRLTLIEANIMIYMNRPINPYVHIHVGSF